MGTQYRGQVLGQDSNKKIKPVKQVTPPIIYKCSICFRILKWDSGWFGGTLYFGDDEELQKNNIPINKIRPEIKYVLGDCCR